MAHHEVEILSFLARSKRNCRTRRIKSATVIGGPQTNPAMNHHPSGETGDTISRWIAHILPTNTSHGVGCATDVKTSGNISLRRGSPNESVASPRHSVINTCNHRAKRPTTNSPAKKPNGNVQNGGRLFTGLTMRLSDAGLHRRRTKALYPNHRLPPWLTEDVTRDRSNRLLDPNASY